MNAVDRLLSLDGKSLEVWKTPNRMVAVAFQRGEVKEGDFLVSYFGVGNTVQAACEDYMEKIQGKTLVFDANTSRRMEVRVL